jgi:hypothetical protein
MRRLSASSGGCFSFRISSASSAIAPPVLAEFAFDPIEPLRHVLIDGRNLPQLDEGADRDIHLHRTLAVQDGREHGHAVLGESVWEIAAATVATGST